MNIGITLIFCEKKEEVINGVLTSFVINCNLASFNKTVEKLIAKVLKKDNLIYLGINDAFAIGGTFDSGELLGRSTIYEYDNLKKAKQLIPEKLSFDKLNKTKWYNVSLIYLVRDVDFEKYTISTITIFKSKINEVKVNALKIGRSSKFLNKIKKSNVVKVEQVQFVGIEEISGIEIELKQFQKLYASLGDMDELMGEIIEEKDLKEKLYSIYTH